LGTGKSSAARFAALLQQRADLCRFVNGQLEPFQQKWAPLLLPGPDPGIGNATKQRL
jgi:hypothetical protein